MNVKHEIEEMMHLENYFRIPFDEPPKKRQDAVNQRISDLLEYDKKTKGAISSFSDFAPWAKTFVEYLFAQREAWEKLMIYPDSRPNNVSPDFIAGNIRMVSSIITKVLNDEKCNKELSKIRQAELEAINNQLP